MAAESKPKRSSVFLEVAVVGGAVDDGLPQARERDARVDGVVRKQRVDDGHEVVDERGDERLHHLARLDVGQRVAHPRRRVLVAGVVPGQHDQHQVVDGALLGIKRGDAHLRHLGNDLVHFAQQPVGVVDVLRLDGVQHVVHQAQDLGVGDGGVADDPRRARRRKLDAAVAVLHVHAADARAQLDVHAAGQRIAHQRPAPARRCRHRAGSRPATGAGPSGRFPPGWGAACRSPCC